MRETTARLLHTLAVERVPAIEFASESKLFLSKEIGARTALLEAWLNAGFDLGKQRGPVAKAPWLRAPAGTAAARE
jgi:hypothetical protein